MKKNIHKFISLISFLGCFYRNLAFLKTDAVLLNSELLLWKSWEQLCSFRFFECQIIASKWKIIHIFLQVGVILLQYQRRKVVRIYFSYFTIVIRAGVEIGCLKFYYIYAATCFIFVMETSACIEWWGCLLVDPS